jgi:hypothetical protein
MAKRNENECAFCAEELSAEQPVIGQDWKVYCSPACARRGEALSSAEMAKLMQHICDRHWPLAA